MTAPNAAITTNTCNVAQQQQHSNDVYNSQAFNTKQVDNFYLYAGPSLGLHGHETTLTNDHMLISQDEESISPMNGSGGSVFHLAVADSCSNKRGRPCDFFSDY
jgi:hypothetical protein